MTTGPAPYQVITVPTGKPWNENSYVVRHVPSGAQLVIDPGGAAEQIEQAVLAGGGRLTGIYLTHAHHDHVGAVTALTQRFGVVGRLHQADGRLLRHAPMYALRFAGRHLEPVENCQAYALPAKFSLGGQPVRILHTPGHTPGSVCYWLDGYAFTGDTLFYEHVGRTDLPGGDADQLTASVGGLLELLPAETLLLPGHGQAWTVAEARRWWASVEAPPPYKVFAKSDADE